MQPIGIQRGRQHLTQDRGRGTGAGKVGKEARVVPLRDRRHNHAVEIAQDDFKRFSLLGRGARKRVKQLSRFYLGQHRIIGQLAQVFCDPVHGFMPGAAEIFNVLFSGNLGLCFSFWLFHKVFYLERVTCN